MTGALKLPIGGREIGLDCRTFLIADIAANHDGSLERAKSLIRLAAESGADAAKFQHFQAETIVSDFGFKSLPSQLSHQAKWSKSVFEVYKDASLPLEWTPELKRCCDEAGVEFMTAPYSRHLADFAEPFVNVFKVGSGDITDIGFLEHLAKKGKSMILATGASSMEEVEAAVSAILKINAQLAVLQCNTNYTASVDNFKSVNLRVIETFAKRFPGLPLGLSDHTPGHSAVLGAVALGARIIEKHFTDDISRTGPDHKFSMTPATWREMAGKVRELEDALGDGVKRIEENERETVVLQRRSIRAARPLPAGHTLRAEDMICLRPCPPSSFPPSRMPELAGRTLKRDLKAGEHLSPDSVN